MFAAMPLGSPFARLLTFLALIGISQGKIWGQSDYDFTNVLTGRADEECHQMDNDPIECRLDTTCVYCCSNDRCYDSTTFTEACPTGCQEWCGDPEACVESGCAYNACSKKCTDRETGCHPHDGLGAEVCTNAGCYPCENNGYVYCLPEPPADPTECSSAGLTPTDGHFFEGCGEDLPQGENITLPMKSTCLNIPNIPAGDGRFTWRDTVSEVWLPKSTCLILYNELNCCGHSVRINQMMNNLCANGDVFFNDIAKSYRLC